MGIGGTIVMVVERESEELTMEVAVTVTVAPDGIVAGAVYTIAPTSSLLLNLPQAFGLPQLME
jgi:hypothetical protein